MLGQSKTVFQAEIDAACEIIDFWRFNVHYGQELLDEQPIERPHDVESARVPRARGVRLRGHAVQLHVDCRQPADRAGADGQHGRLEAGVERDVLGALPDEAATRRPACRPASSTSSPATPAMISKVAAVASRSRRRPLHRQHRSLQRHVEDDRRVDVAATAPTRASSAKPAARTSSSRTRRPMPAALAVGDRARRLRVPGPEVLGREPRLRPAIALERRARSRRSR